MKLGPFCQVFRVHVPGLYKGAKERNLTVSFESVCLPGAFLKQKNYDMILQKRDGTDLFGEEFFLFSLLLSFVCFFSSGYFFNFP